MPTRIGCHFQSRICGTGMLLTAVMFATCSFISPAASVSCLAQEESSESTDTASADPLAGVEGEVGEASEAPDMNIEIPDEFADFGEDSDFGAPELSQEEETTANNIKMIIWVGFGVLLLIIVMFVVKKKKPAEPTS